MANYTDTIGMDSLTMFQVLQSCPGISFKIRKSRSIKIACRSSGTPVIYPQAGNPMPCEVISNNQKSFMFEESIIAVLGSAA